MTLGLLVLLVLGGAYGPGLIRGSATIRVDSTPPGATVVLNGDERGVTPVEITGVPPGEAMLHLRHPHRGDDLVRLTLERGDSKTHHVSFPPAFGALEVVTNPRGAQVILNGSALDQVTPTTIDSIPTGEHKVEVSIYGRESKTATIEVFPGTTTRHALELERVPMGALTLQLTPANATVELLDAPLPYSSGVRLPIGTYRLRVSSPGYDAREMDVTVAHGPNRKRVDLARQYGRLAVDIRPANATVTVAAKSEGGRPRPFSEQMHLPAGPFTIRATAMGYRNLVRNLTMTPAGISLRLDMKRLDVTPGRRFRDEMRSGGEGPELVIVGPGAFVMGSDSGPRDEGPAREVQISQPFAIGIYEVKTAEFNRFRKAHSHGTNASGERQRPDAVVPWATSGAGPQAEPEAPAVGHSEANKLPATGLSLRDALDYLAFLSRETGHTYRLPSEAEWEYAARAGSDTLYYFGDDPDALCEHANVADETLGEPYPYYQTANCRDGFIRLAPVGSFKPNAFGLYDVIGNVEEWVADCWHGTYKGAPRDARAWDAGCARFNVVRGGAYDAPPDDQRMTFRTMGGDASGSRGMRVVREL
ncbi:MAG: SUMF1/EgtB/PvdO family nonheme iron enzyme [Gammaproteobacteria bacterium]|nr:SUMF1/EgtB/PvdO family nonheme iron enzyme [Gammaproteobacteria bacterium]MDE0227041.1 SUMF1/EgtB/PvdO family nonheme iron enzyme [Gammaproteobacteria bacterium]MDE0452184.1 SUMF1/EgtB/PvdO family nonheme iron enzyme [Gammaproteobacteria bacterium]